METLEEKPSAGPPAKVQKAPTPWSDAGPILFMLVVITGLVAFRAHIFTQAANDLYFVSGGVHENFANPAAFFSWMTDQPPNGATVALASILFIAAFAGWEISLHKLAGSPARRQLGRQLRQIWVARLGGLALLALLIICYQYSSQPCFSPSSSSCTIGQVAQAIPVARNLWYACAGVGAVEILVVLDLASKAHKAVARARQA